MYCRFKPENLDEIVHGMKAIGEVLVPFNFPRVPYNFLEDDLGIFRAREVVIDGYSLFLHYQKSDYGEYFIESLQIHNLKSPFLPFCLICKLGKRFLGSDYLSLVEIFKENRKIYVWSVSSNKNDQPIPMPKFQNTEECVYEGLHYLYLQPNQVDFL